MSMISNGWLCVPGPTVHEIFIGCPFAYVSPPLGESILKLRESVGSAPEPDTRLPEHDCASFARVRGPTKPYPVVSGSPDETTPCAFCHRCTARIVAGPKYPVTRASG